MFENEIEMDNKIVGQATAILGSGTCWEREGELKGVSWRVCDKKNNSDTNSNNNNNERK